MDSDAYNFHRYRRYSNHLYVGAYLYPSYYLVPVVAIIVMLLATGAWVTVRGHQHQRVASYLATFVSITLASTYAMHYSLIGAMIAFGLALIVLLVPALRALDFFVIGVGFSLTVLDVVITTVCSLHYGYPTRYRSWLVLAGMLVVAVGCGLCINKYKTPKHIIAATSCTGAFAVSSAVVAALDLMVGLESVEWYLVILLGVGGVLMFAGTRYQLAALNNAIESLPVATPVYDKELV